MSPRGPSRIDLFSLRKSAMALNDDYEDKYLRYQVENGKLYYIPFPDEGSSHLLIENNICCRTGSKYFHQHYGRENILRNKIFVFGKQRNIVLTRMDKHLTFTAF